MDPLERFPSTSPNSVIHQRNVKYSKLPKKLINEHGQATKLLLCSCKTKQMITFHISWMTCFLCFFVWFCTANICHIIAKDTANLTMTQHQLAGALCITATAFFRPFIAGLCFRFGSRVCFAIILIPTALALIFMAWIQSGIGYIVFYVFLGIAGASFVVTQYHITRMFSPRIMGYAQGMAAGFANFGGGCANFVMPVLIHYSGEYVTWRWWMVIFAVIVLISCFIYYFATEDHPKIISSEPSPPEPQMPRDLVHVIENETHPIPDRQIDLGTWKDAVADYRTGILSLCYGACFGVEVIFYLCAAPYYMMEYGLSDITAGLFVMIWSSTNLFARPLGGWLSDKYAMESRVKMLFRLLFFESIFLMLFGIIGHNSLFASVAVSLLFSVCVQMAEGIVFNVARLVQPKSVTHVIGIVGTGGNLSAVFFMFVVFIPWRMSDFDAQYQYTWTVVGGIVMIIAFAALKLKFTEREGLERDPREQGTHRLDGLETPICATPVPLINQPALI